MNAKIILAALVAATGFAATAQAHQLAYTEGDVAPVVQAQSTLTRAEVQAQVTRQAGVQLAYSEGSTASVAATPSTLTRGEVRAEALKATRLGAIELPYNEGGAL